jgi:hypothetical protein
MRGRRVGIHDGRRKSVRLLLVIITVFVPQTNVLPAELSRRYWPAALNNWPPVEVAPGQAATAHDERLNYDPSRAGRRMSAPASRI